MKNLEDMLSSNEKILYEKVLVELDKNLSFFVSSTPEKITSYLVDQCKFDKDEIHSLFKKITLLNS